MPVGLYYARWSLLCPLVSIMPVGLYYARWSLLCPLVSIMKDTVDQHTCHGNFATRCAGTVVKRGFAGLEAKPSRAGLQNLWGRDHFAGVLWQFLHELRLVVVLAAAE